MYPDMTSPDYRAGYRAALDLAIELCDQRMRQNSRFIGGKDGTFVALVKENELLCMALRDRLRQVP